MSNNDIYNTETEMLSLISDEMEAEFKVATSQAVENSEDSFTFYGYEIETSTAVDVVKAMNKARTYH